MVDYLKSTGGDSSFSSRAKRAVELGIVKSPTQYTGSAEQNVSLLNKLKLGSSGAPTNPASVSNLTDASRFINSGQSTDIATAEGADAPPVRSTASDLLSAFQSLVPTTTKPTAPGFEQQYNTLKEEKNIDTLETSINDLDAQEQDLRAQLRVSKNAELGKPVALNVIEGRVGEQERNFSERLDTIGREKTRKVNELRAANDAVEKIMTFKKLDYDVAKDDYDKQFSQNITLFNTIKGISDTANSERDRAQDNARSNLQIIYNAVSEGKANPSALDDSTRAKISGLELQAGLPQGFFDTLKTNKPDSKIISTTTRTTGGEKYADIIYQNADGSLTTSQMRLGATTEGTGGDVNTPKEAYGVINQLAQPGVTMSDGTPYIYKADDGKQYLTAAGFKTLIREASTAGVSRSNFISQYSDLIDPGGADGYGLNKKERDYLGV